MVATGSALSADSRLASPPSPDEIEHGGGWSRTAGNALSLVLPLVVIMLLWEIVARTSGVPAAVLPPLSDIFAAIFRLGIEGTLWKDVWGTMSRLFQSVFVGIVIGTLLGVLIGYFRSWERALVAPMNFLLAIPGTAMFPLSMIWFGLTEMAIISILIYEVALTVMLNTWTGVKTVDNSLIRAGRAFGVRGFGLFWRVLIPAALPSIISGYRLAFARCWRILIIAEMLVSVSSGLGYRIYWAREFFQSDVVYGSLFVVGFVGLLIERVLLRSLEVMTVERWGTMRELS
jgi:ABC-type nitrate/sulfonate/bicarbonate transport system permease component